MMCKWIMIPLLLLVCNFSAFGQDSLKQNFLKAYQSDAETLAAFCENSHLEAKTLTRQEQFEEDKVVGIVEVSGHWDFVANHPRYRWVGETQAKPNTEMVGFAFVGSPDLLFRLRKPQSSSKYSVLSIANSPPTQVYENFITSIRSRATASYAPFSIFDTKISDFLSDKAVSVTRFDHIKSGEEAIVHLEWTAIEPKRRGFFEFAEAGHLLREYEFQFLEIKNKKGNPIDSKHRCKIDYDVTNSSSPKVKRVHTWIDFEGRKSEETITDILVTEAATQNASQFTLQDFGISTEQMPNRIPFVAILLITAFACALGGWGIRRYLNMQDDPLKSKTTA